MAEPNQSEFIEYIIRELSEPIRQGDIFIWSNSENNPWKKFGIIITADCDLAFNKHRDVLSYCPILTFQDFLKLYWINDDLSKSVIKQTEKLAERLSKARRKNRPELDQPVLPNQIQGWLNRRGVEGILEDIKEPEGNNKDSIRNDLGLLNETLEAFNYEDLILQFKTLAKSRILQSNPKDIELKSSLNKIWSEYTKKINSLPGDLFFVNALSPEYNGGFIISLRRIAEIQSDEIAIKPTMILKSNAIRISQLKATIRYRITQKLAAVFTDIGLPTEYENLCLKTMANIASNLKIAE